MEHKKLLNDVKTNISLEYERHNESLASQLRCLLEYLRNIGIEKGTYTFNSDVSRKTNIQSFSLTEESITIRTVNRGSDRFSDFCYDLNIKTLSDNTLDLAFFFDKLQSIIANLSTNS